MLRHLRLPTLLFCCLVTLVACQSPIPTAISPVPSPFPTVMASLPPLTVSPVPEPLPTATRPMLLLEPTLTTPILPQALSGTWQFWPAAYLPQAALDVVASDNTIWVGTSFGVVRLDPQTREYTAFGRPGMTGQILPIEDGKVFATNQEGLWYFDGYSWSRRLEFSNWPVDMSGVDVNGDFWLEWTESRYQPAFRFEGHDPPRDKSWPGIYVEMSSRHAPFDCGWWRIYRSSTFTYRSLEECQRLVKAQAVINQIHAYGPFAADVDGTLWWANDTTLSHLAADGLMLSQFPVARNYRLAADPKHGVWLATQEGLFFSGGKTLQHVSIGLEKHTLYPTGSIAIDTSGRVWTTKVHGLQRLDTHTQRWSRVDDALVGHLLNMINIEGLAAAVDGGVWIWGIRDRDILFHYDGRQITPLAPPDPRCGSMPAMASPSPSCRSCCGRTR